MSGVGHHSLQVTTFRKNERSRIPPINYAFLTDGIRQPEKASRSHCEYRNR